MKKILFSLLLTMPLAGCASDGDSQFIDGFRPPAPAGDEIQIVAPPVRGITPGQDITICSYIDDRVTADTDIISYQGFQSTNGGHHVILYAVTQQQAANSHECNEDDMLNAKFLGGAGADTPSEKLPEGVVFRMPANTQLLLQTHWINASDQTIDGQGAFNLKVTGAKPEHQVAQILTVVNTEFVIPVGKGTAASDCTVEQRLNVFSLSGHMHEWGTRNSITYTPVNGEPKMLYDTPWDPSFIFNAPRNTYTTANPLVFSPGDKLHVDCEFNNTTTDPLPFPTEMCIGVAYGYPMDKQLNCVDGHWPRD